MTRSFKFLHSSDLHLGKPFGQFPEGIRGRLREARHGALGRLAASARAGGARHIVLAGDTFDAETPARDTLAQALQAMALAEDITWVILPGNHDSLAASELWRRMAQMQPQNVRLALTPEPFALEEGVWLLPAPCTQRRPGRDLTEEMQAATPEGVLRLGLGHGGVTDFSADEDGDKGVIAPDRARRAGLSYLALGDWHGTLQVSPETWYCGTPEADSFKHPSQSALLVEIGAGAPHVARVGGSQFGWQSHRIEMLPGMEAVALLDAVLPEAALQRDSLLQLSFFGRTDLQSRTALEARLEKLRDQFGWFDADLAGLGIEARLEDLDLIDRAGALRSAADALRRDAEDPSQSAEERQIAEAALARLFSLVAELSQ